MQTVSGNPRPDLLTYLIEMSFVLTAPARRNSTVLFKRPTPGIIFAIAIKPARLRHFWQGAEVQNPLRLPRETTSKFRKVVRDRQFLTLLTSKCASSRSDMQLLISHAARWLRTRRFREPTFLPSGAQKLWKNTVLRDFSIFSCVLTFFFDLLSSADSFSSLTSSLLTLSLL